MSETVNVAKSPEKSREESVLTPPVDVVEDRTGIMLYADLPGVARDNLHLKVEGDSLTIEGELSLPTPEGMEATHAEVTRARYRRVFSLSRELDAEKVDATFQNGVLQLRIPKADHAQPRRIDIRVA